MTDAARASPGIGRLVWSIAFPAMITNLATALFGLADMWTIGRLGDPAAQGSVELGAKFMMGLLTVFNFLRTSTIALTAQGAGRGDGEAQAATLVRGLAVAALIGTAIVATRALTVPAGLGLLEATGAVRAQASAYVTLRYWGAPFWLADCVLVGWLIGRRRVRIVLAAEVTANLVHISLDLGLVLGLGWGVEGVALATVLSETARFAILALVALRDPAAREAGKCLLSRATYRRRELAALFALNRDLFVRTVLLNGAFLVFARFGAKQGATTLAANGVMFQLFMLSALLLDGFESAAQVLCGEARGAGDRDAFVRSVRANLAGAGICALGIAAVYAVAGRAIAGQFSTDPGVAATLGGLAWWAIAMPLVGFASFVLDGVMVGAGWTRAMLATMGVALAGYLALLAGLSPLGNAGLWIAFTAFFALRGAGQIVILPRLVRGSFSAS